MPNVDLNHSYNLGLYGVELKKELKSHSIVRLKNCNEDLKISRHLYDKLIDAIQHSSITQVNFPKIMFGLELEFVGSAKSSDLSNFNSAIKDLVGCTPDGDSAYCSDVYHYSHNNGKKWVLGRDGSINYSMSNLSCPYGYELSSPKLDLFNKDHIQLVSNVIDYIKKYLHGEVNDSCGTHIHIGFTCNGVEPKVLQRVLLAYSDLEKSVFDPIVPKSRRRNKFCGTTLPNIHRKYQKLSARYCEPELFTMDYKSIRFEFRQLEGTLDLNTIINWAKLQTYVLYDTFDSVVRGKFYYNDLRESLKCKNIFDILFSYSFDSDLINFFIDRAIKFRSRSI